ncbi:unnamed protein product [Cochlearia groenlandica]
MSLRRFLSSRSKSSTSGAAPPVVAARSIEKEEVHGNRFDVSKAKEDHPRYAYYKGYDLAKENIINKTCFQGVATEDEIQDFAGNILPNIHMANTSDEKKKELTEQGVRMALKHFAFLPDLEG